MAGREFRWTVRADVSRITGRGMWRDVLVQLLVGETYTYVFWMRLCGRLAASGAPVQPLLFLARIILRHFRYRMGINIPYSTQIGPGLLIGHAGGVVVNAASRIGCNCNISHNVTIGSTKGIRAGVPTIGDNVYIGPGAVLIGNICIGGNAAIGANAVVVEDVPEGTTVAGAPARVVSYNGSRGWVNRTGYIDRRK